MLLTGAGDAAAAHALPQSGRHGDDRGRGVRTSHAGCRAYQCAAPGSECQLVGGGDSSGTDGGQRGPAVRWTRQLRRVVYRRRIHPAQRPRYCSHIRCPVFVLHSLSIVFSLLQARAQCPRLWRVDRRAWLRRAAGGSASSPAPATRRSGTALRPPLRLLETCLQIGLSLTTASCSYPCRWCRTAPPSCAWSPARRGQGRQPGSSEQSTLSLSWRPSVSAPR